MDQDRVVPHEFGQGVRMMDRSQKRREEGNKEHIPVQLTMVSHNSTRLLQLYRVLSIYGVRASGTVAVQLDPADRIQPPGGVAHARKV